jgi:methyl-accepting chemotaxis protein
MLQLGKYRELLAFLPDLKRDWALLRRTSSSDDLAMLRAQLQAAIGSNVAVMVMAVLFFIAATALIANVIRPRFSLFGAPLVVASQLVIFRLHLALKDYDAEADPEGRLLMKIRNRFVEHVGIGSLCWAGLICDLWLIPGGMEHVIAGATAFGLVGVGAMTFLCMPPAMFVWLVVVTGGGLLGPLLSEEAIPWYFYVAVAVYGFALLLISMRQWAAFISSIEDARSFAYARAEFYEQEKERLAALQIERSKAETARRDERILAESERQTMMQQLAGEFERSIHATIDAVGSAVVAVSESAQQLATIATQTRDRSDAMADMASNMDEAIQTVATAASQLSDAAAAISRQVDAQVEASLAAAGSSRDGSAAMNALVADTEKVEAIANVISDVASKTNLLALNATIEAARAGEAGRGFAVVAQEVKSLAGQTRGAIASVTETVELIRDQMQQSACAVESVIGRMVVVQDGASNIASAISQQYAATHEITENALSAAHDAQRVKSYSNDVHDVAQRVGELADEMHVVMTGLEERAGALRSTSQAFLERLRAA